LGRGVQVKAGSYRYNARAGVGEVRIALANRTRPRQALQGPLALVVTGAELAEPSSPAVPAYRLVTLPPEGLKPGRSTRPIMLRLVPPPRGVPPVYPRQTAWKLG
jgi:hypothetical protein